MSESTTVFRPCSRCGFGMLPSEIDTCDVCLDLEKKLEDEEHSRRIGTVYNALDELNIAEAEDARREKNGHD